MQKIVIEILDSIIVLKKDENYINNSLGVMIALDVTSTSNVRTEANYINYKSFYCTAMHKRIWKAGYG